MWLKGRSSLLEYSSWVSVGHSVELPKLKSLKYFKIVLTIFLVMLTEQFLQCGSAVSSTNHLENHVELFLFLSN